MDSSGSSAAGRFVDRFGLERFGLVRHILEFGVLQNQFDHLAFDDLISQNVHQAALFQLGPHPADTFAALRSAISRISAS